MDINEKWKIFKSTSYEDYMYIVDEEFGEGYSIEEKEEIAFQMWLLDIEIGKPNESINFFKLCEMVK